MRRRTAIRHEFLEFIPSSLKEGVLYISIKYATAVHNCLCGCGNKVVTPLHPTDWQLTFDGETVSLRPSIGNWAFPCQSHYWITNDKIKWAQKWSTEEIESGRQLDRLNKKRFYKRKQP